MKKHSSSLIQKNSNLNTGIKFLRYMILRLACLSDRAWQVEKDLIQAKIQNYSNLCPMMDHKDQRVK